MRTRTVLLVLVVVSFVCGVLLLQRKSTVSGGKFKTPNERTAGDRIQAKSSKLQHADPPAEPASASEVLRGVLLIGRVVDSRRRPVSGAKVVVLLSDRPAVSALSEGEGKFAIQIGSRPRLRWLDGSLVATVGDLVGAVPLYLAARGTDRQDSGTVVLFPGCELNVKVVDSDGVVAGATVHVRKDGVGPSLARVVSDSQGTARIQALPSGEMAVVALAPDGRRVRARTTLPQPGPDPLELRFGESRTVHVLVLEAATGRPLPGISIELQERVRISIGYVCLVREPAQEIVPTDTDGRTTIPGVGRDEELQLVPRTAGYWLTGLARSDQSGIAIPPNATAVKLELVPGRTVSWQVASGEVPVPPEGSVIRFEAAPGTASSLRGNLPSSQGRIENSRLVVEGIPPRYVHALAVAPDGAIAYVLAQNYGETGSGISFRRPRKVEVLLTDAEGEPAAGRGILLRNPGNNPWPVGATTDAAGRCLIEGIHGGRWNVCLCEDSSLYWDAVVLGAVDLDAGDARFEAVMPRIVDVLARIRIDQQVRLPGEYHIQVGKHLPISVAEHPDNGELLLRAYLGQPELPITVTLNARGYPPTEGRAEIRSTGRYEVDLSLGSGGAFLVEVSPPGTRVNLELQSWDFAHNCWVPQHVRGMPSLSVPGFDGSFRFAPLSEGRYRVRDSLSGLVSAEGDIGAAGLTSHVRMTLDNGGQVRGFVEYPPGTKWEDVRVIVEGHVIEMTSEHGVRIGKDRQFRVRVPGDRRVTLRPWHPVLVPAPVGGSVEVVGVQEGVILRLQEGAVVSFRPEPAIVSGNIRVRLFAARPTGPHIAEYRALVSEGVARFGGQDPGRYTLWIDAPPYAPACVSRVELGAGRTDLGEVRFVRGAIIHLQVLTREGHAAPRVDLSARCLDDPSYVRSVSSESEREILLQGLGPGRFQVRARAPDIHGGRVIDQTVDLDGYSESRLTLDLR